MSVRTSTNRQRVPAQYSFLSGEARRQHKELTEKYQSTEQQKESYHEGSFHLGATLASRPLSSKNKRSLFKKIGALIKTGAVREKTSQVQHDSSMLASSMLTQTMMASRKAQISTIYNELESLLRSTANNWILSHDLTVSFQGSLKAQLAFTRHYAEHLNFNGTADVSEMKAYVFGKWDRVNNILAVHEVRATGRVVHELFRTSGELLEVFGAAKETYVRFGQIKEKVLMAVGPEGPPTTMMVGELF
jgi:hypothetical protein